MAFTPDFTAATTLDAVNEMITSIGLSPVNTLSVQGIKDVAVAQRTLHNVSRKVQSKGWWFNVDRDFPLLPEEGMHHIKVPEDAISIRCEDRGRNLVERKRLLYDLDRNSYNFENQNNLKFRIVRFLDFEDIPQTARDYIAMRAIRVFQARAVGSPVLKTYTDQDEALAYAEMLREHLKGSNTNMFRRPSMTNRILHRRY